MPDKKNRVILTVTILVAFMALILGLFISQYVYSKKKIDISQFHGTYLEEPREVNQFNLEGIDQKKFDNASLKGNWTMVFFGFTQCGYLCPTTMAELNKMYGLLKEKGVKTLPHIVMISVDPERDTLKKLNVYVKAFNPNFYAATGNENSIKLLTREIGIAYTKVALLNGTDADSYDIEHTGTIILFNPQGELNAFFTTPHQAEVLARDYQSLVPKV